MSWDDGKHAKVNKVQITYDDVIYSIQVTYAGTALQSQRRGSVGPSLPKQTIVFIFSVLIHERAPLILALSYGFYQKNN